MERERLIVKGRKRRYTHFFVVLAFIRLRKRSKKSRHRRFVLEQWLKTQRSYRSDLQLAIKFIKTPLMKAGLIDKQGVRVLCPQFEQMSELSKEMIQTVGVIESQLNPNKIIIGQALIKLGKFYMLYSTYFGNRIKSDKLLKQLFEEHQKEMREIQEPFKVQAKISDDRKANMGISDCLSQPQYRMFKYVLLLKQYLKKMPRWHPDNESIRRALSVFQQMNQKNNELMISLEAQQKKIKLDKLFGKPIYDSSHYIVQMSADSLYFPVKLYIFSNMVIIAAVQNILGFKQERRFVNMSLNQYSYVHSKPSGKYFKNGLLLCGQYEALHLFTPDPGERQQILKTMQNVLASLQSSAVARRRKQKASLNEMPGKLSFVLNVGQQVVFEPQFRIQVMHIEVRPLSTFSNDTVYLTRFAGPLWLQDCSLVGMTGGRVRRGVWQFVQMHLSQVMQLYQTLRQEYPQIQFPQIDPLTKQMNAWTESKKNTKMFQVRGFLFQQFFNFVLRHPTVMRNPMQIIHKYKVLPVFWQYQIKKNDYLSGRGEQAKRDHTQYQYGRIHCKLCDLVLKAPLQQLQKIRIDLMHGKRADHCFNAFCLIRLRIAALPEMGFYSVQRVLWRQLLETGRMDYALLPRQQLHKRYQEVQVWTCGQTQKHSVLIDYRRKVGQMMIDLGYFLGLQDALDFRLVLRYDGKERLLDQDEVLFDLIAKYQLPAVQRQDANRQSRHSVNITTMHKEEGLFSFLSSVFVSKVDSCLQFRKTIFLPKQIQIRSFSDSPKRAKYVIEQFYFRLKRGQIALQIQDWAEACALWIVSNTFSGIHTTSNAQLLSSAAQKLIPEPWIRISQQKAFVKIFADTIDSFKKKTFENITQKELMNCYKRCIRVFYRSVWSYSYVVLVSARDIPIEVISDSMGPLQGDCWLGVNFKQLVVFRQPTSLSPVIKLSLQDVKITHTTFSIFVQHSYDVGLVTESNIEQTGPKSSVLRFDGRLLYHFSYLIELYCSLKRIFTTVV